MKTISSSVESWLEQKPFIVEHIAQGIVNYSALARKIQRDIEQNHGEKVSREAIAMALSRQTQSLKSSNLNDASMYIGDITLQSGLSVVNFASVNFYHSIQAAVTKLNVLGEFYVLTQGVKQAGLITKTTILKTLPIDNNQIIYAVDNQVGITVTLKTGHEPVLGVCAFIVSLVSLNGVNLEEVISTKDEMTLVVDESFAQQATAVLLKASKN